MGPDGTTKYYYDGIRPIWETDSGGAMTAQLDRDPFGNLLSRKEPTARRYYHFDGLGSTTALTNESGTMAATMLYDAWGLQRTATGSGHGKYRFTGAEFDSATGLYHMGARFYDPNLGRWLSEDPVQDKFFEPNTLNFYAYVQNNPGICVDPDGKVLILVAAGVAAVGAGLGLGLYLGSHQGSATVGGAIVWTGAGAAIGFGVGLAASYAATAGPGLSVVIARSIVDPARRVVAVMDRALARGWTSAENFLAHFEKHGQQVASAFGRASVTMSEYAQLAKSALAQTGGGSGRVQLTWGGATHWVRIIVNEFGEVVSFFPTGPRK